MILVALFWLATGDVAAADSIPDVAAAPCVACGSEVSNPRVLYSPEEWQALEKGSILLLTEEALPSPNGADRPQENVAHGLIRHSPERVWRVLTDFEEWPRFMPHITRTRITRRDGPRTWVHQRYRVVLLGLEHTTVYRLDPRFGRLSWSLDRTQKHDIRFSEGRWQLIPASGGGETLIRYAAAMDAGRRIPKTVEDMLKRRSLSNLLSNLRSEVERRYGNGSAE